MSLYSRILVPTDGSADGQRAVGHAVELAAVHDATLSAVYVVNTAAYTGLPMETTWEGIDSLLRTDAQRALETVEQLGERHGVPVETTVLEGSPSKEILRCVDTDGCDLIVMGTHGRGGIDRLLLGSVAEKVVRGARVPVLTVRVGDDPAHVEGIAEAEHEGTAEAEHSSTAETDGPTAADFPTG